MYVFIYFFIVDHAVCSVGIKHNIICTTNKMWLKHDFFFLLYFNVLQHFIDFKVFFGIFLSRYTLIFYIYEYFNKNLMSNLKTINRKR